MQDVVAVVVTYDRLELLKRCIRCLQEQTTSCDVVVVDNASPQSTKSWLAAEAERWPALRVRTLTTNTGGAGGFNCGIQWAVQTGYRYIWLMDDDCLPHPDALNKLLETSAALGGPDKYGFLSSAVLWTDGSECLMNRQKPVKVSRQVHLPAQLTQVEQATFVSLFLPARTIRKAGLPISQYFIWGDDIEYTRRIAVRQACPSYLVRNSRVVHAMAKNTGSSIATDDLARLERYTLACRNESFTYRQEGLSGFVRYTGRRIRDLWNIIWRARGNRLKRITALFKGVFLGLTFHPEIEFLQSSN